MKNGCLLIIYEVFALRNFQPIDIHFFSQVRISLVFNWLIYSAFSQNMQEKNLKSIINKSFRAKMHYRFKATKGLLNNVLHIVPRWNSVAFLNLNSSRPTSSYPLQTYSTNVLSWTKIHFQPIAPGTPRVWPLFILEYMYVKIKTTAVSLHVHLQSLLLFSFIHQYCKHPRSLSLSKCRVVRMSRRSLMPWVT